MPDDGSFVDALLALAGDAAGFHAPGSAERALNGGLQAALARRMRTVLAQDDAPRKVA